MGRPQSEETKEKIRKALLGRVVPEEEKRKMSLGRMGMKLSEEHKQHIRDQAKNNPNFGMKGKQLSEEARQKIRDSKLGKHFAPHTEERKEKIRKTLMGHPVLEEVREKMSKSHTGMKMSEEAKRKLRYMIENNPNFGMRGKHLSAEARKKLRIARIEQIKRDVFHGNQVSPCYNPVACQLIDEYGKANGYNFKHAMNDGEYFIPELGYWLDGYDKERNTAIEYYEKHHNRRVQKDLERETEICNYLSCDFIILWESDLSKSTEFQCKS